MIELARFRYARAEWAFAIGSDPASRLLLAARDRRTYLVLPHRAAGRIVPADALARRPDAATGRVPWEGWYCCVVLLGDADRRRACYGPWPAPNDPGGPPPAAAPHAGGAP